jgi:hypothetical protein
MSDWTEQVAAGRALPVRAFGELVSVLACTTVDPGLACSSLTRAHTLAPALELGGGVSCVSGPEKTARLSLVVAYGRPSHPLSVLSEPEVTLSSGAETRRERIRIWIDEHELEAPEVLDVDAAVHSDYDEGMHALHVRFMGQSADVGGWSKDAWEVLPAHIHLAVAALAPGQHEVRVELRGEPRSRSVQLTAGDSRTALFFAPW